MEELSNLALNFFVVPLSSMILNLTFSPELEVKLHFSTNLTAGDAGIDIRFGARARINNVIQIMMDFAEGAILGLKFIGQLAPFD